MCGIRIYTWHEDPQMDRESWMENVADRDTARYYAMRALKEDPRATRVLVSDAGQIIIDFVQSPGRD
jgi:hypothetical protein